MTELNEVREALGLGRNKDALTADRLQLKK